MPVGTLFSCYFVVIGFGYSTAHIGCAFPKLRFLQLRANFFVTGFGFIRRSRRSWRRFIGAVDFCFFFFLVFFFASFGDGWSAVVGEGRPPRSAAGSPACGGVGPAAGC